MAEVSATVRGRLKVSERLLAPMCYVGFFVPPMALTCILLMASIKLQLEEKGREG